MHEVKSGRVKMKTKRYFFIKGFSLTVFTVLLSLLLIYFGSLILFVLQANDLVSVTLLGWSGWQLVLIHFPWYLVLVAICLIIMIEIMAKRLTVVYRRPLIYSLLFVTILAFFGGWLVERAHVNLFLLDLTQEVEVPVASRLYERFSDLEIERVHQGHLVEKKAEGWLMEFDDGEIVTLDLSGIEKGRRRLSDIDLGQRFIVIGDRLNGVIEVERFRQINGRRP